MKKQIAIAALSALILATGCNKESEANQTFNIAAYNLVTSADPAVLPEVSGTRYVSTFDVGRGKLTFGVSNLMLGGQKLTFATDPAPYQSYNLNLGSGGYHNIFTTQASSAGMAGSTEIRNLKAELTTALYSPNIALSAYPVSYPGDLTLVASYQIGNYTVRTFWPDASFAGIMSTTMGNADPERFEGVLFRVVMDMEKSTANVLMYNIKFSDKMPVQSCLVLKGLSLAFNHDGWVISGQDIIPSQIEGGTETPNPGFPFRKFEMTSEGDLTVAEATFDVGSAFHGEFKGAYCVTLSNVNYDKE